ncbi:uncharacterized protein LOC120437375 [Oreochromis aureus]|uniref:uncharacterized protein LOC120437375 n=1 Tax=Oreochromis aureus TaxID=47969 RepID=UPI001954850C|nr:uncharacterized protein LOC120437375 [Oreochromis aureus]XP_039463845.1 uncharacterized protein LOC120437375 [Oreochromis aureus]
MKVQDLFMGFALVAVISAAPIEDKAVYDEEYHPEDFEIDPTQYEELLQNLQSYEKALEKGFGDEEFLGISFDYGELLGTELENETFLAVGLGVDVSVGALLGDEAALGEGFADVESLATTFGYAELLDTELGNDTLLVAGLGVEMSVGALGEDFGDDDILLAAALGDEPLGATYGYEELLGTETGNETLLAAGLGVEVSVGALLGDEAALGNEELLNVSEEDEKLMEIALENLNLEDVLKAAGSDGEIRPDAE